MPVHNKGSLTPDQISALVRAVFADASVVSSRLFPGKHTNLNHDLQLANPTMDVVLKVYLDVSKRQPWKETHLLRLLTSKTGVPTPGLLHFDDSLALIAHPWALHTRLPGQPLAEVLDTLEEWQLELIGYEIGRYLGHIHQIPQDEFGEFFISDPHRHASEKDRVVSQVKQWLDVCVERELLPIETVHTLDQFFARTSLLNRPRACLIHGAYDEYSVIVERGISGYHVTGIVDLKHATGGSPEMDMSKLLDRRFAEAATFQKGFLDGYTESGELGAKFWDRLRLYKLFTRLGCLSSTQAKRESELETCQQWVYQHLKSLNRA